MYEEGKKTEGASGEKEPGQPESENNSGVRMSAQQRSGEQMSAQQRSGEQRLEQQKLKEQTPQKQTQTTTAIENGVSPTATTTLAESIAKLEKVQSNQMKKLQETIEKTSDRTPLTTRAPAPISTPAPNSTDPTTPISTPAPNSNDPTPPAPISTPTEKKTKEAEEDPTKTVSKKEPSNPTVRNRVKAIEAKVKSQTEKQIEQQKQKGQRQKGGSRRIPRTLKPSSLPSRKKRKSQPLSR
jgi:hypothetical protein